MSGFSRASSAVLVGYIAGLVLANNGADASNDLDISAGAATDSSGVRLMTLAASITKRLDAAWAVGTNQGGLDTGAEANSTWYHVFLISNGSVVDVLFSTSATAPTMPAGYTYKRLIGSIFNNSAGAIRAFIHEAGFLWWKSFEVDYSGSTNDGTTVTLAAPAGRLVQAHLAVTISHGGGPSSYAKPVNATWPGWLNAAGWGCGNAGTYRGQVQAQLNASQCVMQMSQAATGTWISCLGWREPRADS